MDEREAKELKDASSLHDLGKLGIKDHILHKNGTLTKSEYKEMKQHVKLGVSMLDESRLPLFETAKIVAAQHHEKWDGSGYPYGLKGNEIHIYGRIVALADVFDALSFKRSYKKGWTQEEVLLYIKDMSAKHFDPQLVEIFFDNVGDFLEIYNLQVENYQAVEVKKRARIIEWFLRGR
jgi:putative two-component system response regulator